MNLLVDNISFERNERSLFHGLNFELKKCELLHITGTNGSGKSTLLRIVAGLIEASHGKIYWNNYCILKNKESYNSEIHYLGHKNSIKDKLTVIENIKFQAALKKIKLNDQMLAHILKKIGLEDKKDIEAVFLSAGQQRRLALSKLFLSHSTLWLLDEPLNALDSDAQLWMNKEIVHHCENGGMVILTSHQVPEIHYPIHQFSLEHVNA